MSNPFAITKPQAQGNNGLVAGSNGNANLLDAQNQRETSEIQSALVIAKQFPRNQMQAMDRILQSCARPSLAEHALYQYGRGGTNITGPSIRLAEAIAQQWGNINFGIRELEQVNGESVVESFAWDTETNVKQTKVFKVPHVRYTRKGSYKLEDPRDIYENVANQGARRLRACILGVIPSDVVDSAVKACEETMVQNVDVTPERMKNMLEAFKEFGVTKEAIEARIQRRVDSITPALMVQLSKIYNSIKDGMSQPSDWFEIKETKKSSSEKKTAKTSAEALKEKMKKETATAPRKEEKTEEPGKTDPFEENFEGITDSQRKLLFVSLKDAKVSEDLFKENMKSVFGWTSTKDIPQNQFDKMLNWIEAGCPAKK